MYTVDDVGLHFRPNPRIGPAKQSGASDSSSYAKAGCLGTAAGYSRQLTLVLQQTGTPISGGQDPKVQDVQDVYWATPCVLRWVRCPFPFPSEVSRGDLKCRQLWKSLQRESELGA